MKKRKYKKFIVGYVVVLSCALCLFMLPFSAFALDSRDWSLNYNKFDNIAVLASGQVGADIYGTYTHSSNQSTGKSNITMSFSSINMMCGRVLYSTNYGSNLLYLQDGYHYTVELELAYKFHKENTTSSSDIFTGHDFRFVLSASLQTGGSVGNYAVSDAIKPGSSYSQGKYKKLVFDFDISNSDDWPAGTLEGGFLPFTGWGLVDYTDTLIGNYDVTLYVQNMYVKAYSPSDWQAYVAERGFENISSEVVEGLQEYDNSLPDADYSKGQAALDDYESKNNEVESLIDSASVDAALDIRTSVGDWQDGITAAGSFLNYMYEKITFYNGTIPIAVCFSACGLLLGLVRNR